MTKTALVISPHAADAAAFCGGTLIKFCSDGWRVILVRVTNDSKDSIGLTREETIQANAMELHLAARHMGISEIVELGLETDSLADVSKVSLRERFVYLFRKYRPYAVFSFDPFGIYEGNMDHIVTAQAVEEAFWVSCFDLHHPEHFSEGLAPFCVCERWYFGRDLPGANYVVDVTDFMEQNIEALCAHRTMMRNTVNQMRLQVQTWGRSNASLEHAVEVDLRPILSQFLQSRAQGIADRFSLGEGRLGEVFRYLRFGDLEPMIQATSEILPDSEALHRAGIDL